MKKTLLISLLSTLAVFGDHPGESAAKVIKQPAGLSSKSDPEALRKNGFKALFNGTDLSGRKKVGGLANYQVKEEDIRGFGKKIYLKTL